MAVHRIYCKVAIVSFWKTTVTFWDLFIILTKEIYRNMYCVLRFIHLLRGEAGEERAREMLYSAVRENLQYKYE
jgi:hypothetical protein